MGNLESFESEMKELQEEMKKVFEAHKDAIEQMDFAAFLIFVILCFGIFGAKDQSLKEDHNDNS